MSQSVYEEEQRKANRTNEQVKQETKQNTTPESWKQKVKKFIRPPEEGSTDFTNIMTGEQKKDSGSIKEELKKAYDNARETTQDIKPEEVKVPEVKEPEVKKTKETKQEVKGDEVVPKVANRETTQDSKDDYDKYAADEAERRGLGKYIKDGKVDYKKLQRSKIGYQILNALAGGLAGAGAGASGQSAPDMSKSILAKEVAKRDEVVQAADEAERSRLKQKEDMDTFVERLHLSSAENEKVQKALADYMSDLSFSEQQRLNNYLKNVPITDAFKIGLVNNPTGTISTIMNGAGHLIGSDEKIKHFATRKLFH